MSWIETYTNKKFNIFNCTEDDIEVKDIAHSLAMQCRFNGHSKRYYSVAEHSVHVTNVFLDLLNQDNIDWKNTISFHLLALFHDASEAYLCDLPRPIKPYIKEYKTMEKNIQYLIHRKLNIDTDTLNNILKLSNSPCKNILKYLKEADIMMLHTEARQLNMNKDKSWVYTDKYKDFHKKIQCLSPKKSEKLFLDFYKNLKRDNNL